MKFKDSAPLSGRNVYFNQENNHIFFEKSIYLRLALESHCLVLALQPPHLYL